MKNLMLVMVADCKAKSWIGEPMVCQNEWQASQILQQFNARYNQKNKYDFQVFKIGELNPDDTSVPLISCVPELLSSYCDDDDDDSEIFDKKE